MMYKDVSANLNKKWLIFPGKCPVLIFTKNFISRNVKSTVKHSAAYKLNQHINRKEGKGKKTYNGCNLVKAHWASHVKCAYLLT